MIYNIQFKWYSGEETQPFATTTTNSIEIPKGKVGKKIYALIEVNSNVYESSYWTTSKSQDDVQSVSVTNTFTQSQSSDVLVGDKGLSTSTTNNSYTPSIKSSGSYEVTTTSSYKWYFGDDSTPSVDKISTYTLLNGETSNILTKVPSTCYGKYLYCYVTYTIDDNENYTMVNPNKIVSFGQIGKGILTLNNLSIYSIDKTSDTSGTYGDEYRMNIFAGSVQDQTGDSITLWSLTNPLNIEWYLGSSTSMGTLLKTQDGCNVSQQISGDRQIGTIYKGTIGSDGVDNGSLLLTQDISTTNNVVWGKVSSNISWYTIKNQPVSTYSSEVQPDKLTINVVTYPNYDYRVLNTIEIKNSDLFLTTSPSDGNTLITTAGETYTLKMFYGESGLTSVDNLTSSTGYLTQGTNSWYYTMDSNDTGHALYLGVKCDITNQDYSLLESTPLKNFIGIKDGYYIIQYTSTLVNLRDMILDVTIKNSQGLVMDSEKDLRYGATLEAWINATDGNINIEQAEDYDGIENEDNPNTIYYTTTDGEMIELNDPDIKG